MLRAARWKCRTQKIVKKSPSGHHRINLSDDIFTTKARIDEGINDTVTRSCQTAANAQQAQNRHMEYPQYVPDTGFEKSLVVETELAEELEMNSE